MPPSEDAAPSWETMSGRKERGSFLRSRPCGHGMQEGQGRSTVPILRRQALKFRDSLGAPSPPAPLSRPKSRDHQEECFEQPQQGLAGARSCQEGPPAPARSAACFLDDPPWGTLQRAFRPGHHLPAPAQLQDSRLQAGARSGRGAEGDRIWGEESWGPGASEEARQPAEEAPRRPGPPRPGSWPLTPVQGWPPTVSSLSPPPTFLHLEAQAAPHSCPVSPHPPQKAPSRHVGRGSVSTRPLLDPWTSRAQRPEEIPPPPRQESTPHPCPSPHSEHVEGKCGRQTLSASALDRKPRWDGALHLRPVPRPGSPPEATGVWTPLCKRAPTPDPAPLLKGQVPSPARGHPAP